MSTMSQIEDVIESVTDMLAPSEMEAARRARFAFNGLATPPLKPARSFFGLFSRVEVPPGTWGVCYSRDGDPTVLRPGSHWITSTGGGSSTVQLVDATRRRYELPPVSGLSRDRWTVMLRAALAFEVVDPIEVARLADPFASLEAAGRAAILAQIESMPHEALTGAEIGDWRLEVGNWKLEAGGETLADTGTGPAAGLKAVEHGILAHLNERPALAGLRVVDVAIVERRGDERLVKIMQDGEVERAKVAQERETEVVRAGLAQTHLEAEARTAEAARSVAVIEKETQARLAEVEEHMKVLTARTEAEVQEIRQAQEAREAERKRRAEEWRTAKELDLRAMEYQHAETLAIIQGTTQITTETAKSGLLAGVVGGSVRRRPELAGGDARAEVVEEGIHVLKAFREKIAPPLTHFLPRPVGAGFYGDDHDRVRLESLRLERVREAEHELIVRRGQIAGARVWFRLEAPAALQGITLEFVCPDGYPVAAPLLTIVRAGATLERPVADWDVDLYLADLVREVMVELMRGE